MCVCHIELTILLFHRNPMTWFSAFNIHRSFVCMWACPCPYRFNFQWPSPAQYNMNHFFFPLFEKTVQKERIFIWNTYIIEQNAFVCLTVLRTFHFYLPFIKNAIKFCLDVIHFFFFLSVVHLSLLGRAGKKIIKQKNFNMKMMNLFPIWLMSFRESGKKEVTLRAWTMNAQPQQYCITIIAFSLCCCCCCCWQRKREIWHFDEIEDNRHKSISKYIIKSSKFNTFTRLQSNTHTNAAIYWIYFAS